MTSCYFKVASFLQFNAPIIQSTGAEFAKDGHIALRVYDLSKPVTDNCVIINDKYIYHFSMLYSSSVLSDNCNDSGILISTPTPPECLL